ncbi:hypothetical protein RR46_00198 [Papilio xuthus]|uniref:Uncharacterized protein n=1 Tax=Papilio xuthus TaxID=66420 RepID=A0A0N1PIL9_PAPXU|nr:hypothetical protein RR46_00198 [Papilio xuthus]
MEKAKAYIKSSLGGKASPARETDATADAEPRVCFVCGGAGLGDCYAVRVKPDPQSSEPYFPFLGAHPPPAGYQAEGEEEGTVRCCCVCYTFLRQQWEQYDRENKPHSQRFYWMKRLDGKPFIGEYKVDHYGNAFASSSTSVYRQSSCFWVVLSNRLLFYLLVSKRYTLSAFEMSKVL